MKLVPPQSLAARATLLLGLVACAVTGSLGAYFYFTARVSVNRHMDEQLVARAEHLRRLVGNVYTVAELRERPILLEGMLGSEQDVLLVRRPGEAAFMQVNPQRLPVPELRASPPGEVLAARDVAITQLPGGVPVHWVAATARSARDGELVEVVAGHPFGKEVKMIGAYRDNVLLATTVAMLVATGLAFVVLRRGLRPLRKLAAQAEEIHPINLAVRLDAEHAPLEVRHMAQAFNAMLERIATGYERLSQFSADLAHEIRTPVGALIGQTQVLLNQPRDVDEYRELLESNLEELNRLRGIVENILFLAQADHAALVIERRAVSLPEELHKIAEYFEGPADENGLHLEVAAEGTAFVNPSLCQRAVNNLVVNAVRHAARGSTVRLIGTQDAQGAVIAVENQGVPVPPEQLARVFDRFYRGDAARSRFTESNGLGLAIVKAIMSLHGGEAQVHSPTPGSIRFALRFPRAS